MNIFSFLSIFFLILVSSCTNKNTLFRQLKSSQTGIGFENTIVESDSINVLDFENVYNGGGVGVADINNDGLQDIYFTGNLVSNKLYLNKGKFKFEDITGTANVSGDGKWCRGVSVVDINNDGRLDLYISVSASKNSSNRENLLYINKGNDKEGIPHFENMAAVFGLNDTTHSTMGVFFDYDNDGDLDVFIATNEIIPDDFPNRFRPIINDGTHKSTDKLYRNDWNDSLKHPVFTDVSRQAGILIEGYSHNVTITDINKDGWKDIYVTNDYLSSNILYINNGDGTFTDKVREYFKHTSANAMGSDVIDLNNDGLTDVIELDMNPEDNYRKKMMLNANSYQTYQNIEYFGYQYQYVRNTLQMNRGPRVNQKDSIGDPVFSDISFFSGVSETDWSWAPLVTDFDNDGFRDLIITNGFPRDVTDHDFVAFRNEAFSVASKQQLLEQIPAVKIHNYAYRNKGNFLFDDVTNSWGFQIPSFSNGAAYADLDNDGDMDVVINNINDEALLYENTLMNSEATKKNYLRIHLQGDSLNHDGIGTWIELYYQGKQQVYEQTVVHGYLSSIQIDPHFGLGNITKIDSIIIKWPDLKKQTIWNVMSNQTLVVDYKNADSYYNWNRSIFANPILSDITDSLGIDYQQEETDFIDFNIQKLLPHKFSEYGPGLAVGDVDGNGLEDLIAGGSFSHSAEIFLQQKNGKFHQKDLIPRSSSHNKRWEDMGIVLFDADGDNDLDIYIASGSYENEANTNSYQDKLYVNDGAGNFRMDSLVLPQNFTSKSCVRAADYDKDGDLDLFIAGRVEPWKYPKPVSSFIYRNESEKGIIKFTDVTKTIAPSLIDIGLVCDAIWTDFDNDGWQDLILAGEWMPLTFLKSDNGTFKNVSTKTGIGENIGWWGSIIPGDFDNDGDIDYIVGNLGLNSYYKASFQYPVSIYAKDFDNNGSYDAVPTIFLSGSEKDTLRKEYPVHGRDDIIKQMIFLRSKFRNYKSYSVTTFDSIFGSKEMNDVLVLRANTFNHCFIRNIGSLKFELNYLPDESQYSCINGMVAEDFNDDGNLDVLINGNDYGTDVSVGRYDACNGLLLLGDGKGDFQPVSILQSGIYIPGNGKALVKLKSNKNQLLVAASQNRGPLKVYKLNKNVRTIDLEPMDVTVLFIYNNGKKRKTEVGYGSSFLSQSGRFLTVDRNVVSVEVTNNNGTVRKILLQ